MTSALSTRKTNGAILNEIKTEIQQISVDMSADDYERKRRKITELTCQLAFPRTNDLNALLVTQSFLEKLNEFHPAVGVMAEKYFLLENLSAMKNFLEHL